MILCVQIDKLSSCLSALAPLMDCYLNGKPSFPDDTLKWLEDAEKTMSMLRLADGAEMSALRGRILRAADALPSDDGRPKRAAVQRARNAAAAEALERAEAIIRRRVFDAEERLRRFEDKLCEGITAFLLENSLPEKTPPHQVWLNQIWTRFKQFQATRPLAIYVAASLAKVDRSYILDRVLARVAENELEPRSVETVSNSETTPNQ
ncbi:MAG: hypothetical protein JSU94_05235 [Phycisphaerales bacterium]|nr:MAG: hypothetical protein JSU94_05235 [Phycisphaerales bacterium]